MFIGIPMSTSKTQYFINSTYSDYVSEAGFNPVLISPNMDIEVMVNNIDGLLLPGGIDLDPIYYGEDNFNSYGADPEKDQFERGLLYTAAQKGLPIFCICRGLQLVAKEFMQHNEKVWEYLTYYTHIEDHRQVEDQSVARTNCSHFVECDIEGLYNEKITDLSKTSIPVNSMHHQCLTFTTTKIRSLAKENFIPLAWTLRGLRLKKDEKPTEAVCEAFFLKFQNSNVLAVQWHPEELKDLKLLYNFFNKHNNINGKENQKQLIK